MYSFIGWAIGLILSIIVAFVLITPNVEPPNSYALIFIVTFVLCLGGSVLGGSFDD